MHYMIWLFPIPFWSCAIYALIKFLKNPHDSKNKYVTLIFTFGAIAFTVVIPPIFFGLNNLLGIRNIGRFIMDISCLLALFFAYKFLTEFAPRKKKNNYLVLFHLVVAIVVMFVLFFLSDSKMDLLFTVDDVKNIYFFIYNLVFESFFLPVFIFCSLNFGKYSKISKESSTKTRLIFLSLGCAAAFLHGILKTLSLFFDRYFTTSEPILNMSLIGTFLTLIMAISLATGFLWPKFLEKLTDSVANLISLRQIRLNLISLLAQLNDMRTLLFPYSNEKMAHYVKLICKELSLPKKEADPIIEAARLHFTSTNDEGVIKDNRETKTLNPPLAFTEELEFYNQIYYQLRYLHERYDGEENDNGLARENLPLGSRIIKVVNYYYNKLRETKSHEEKIKLIMQNARKELDPKIVEVFIKVLKKEKQFTNDTSREKQLV